jgi:DNA-binding NarL/FixJ family response regulator/tetratricopeptide (TPR) repeat protein
LAGRGREWARLRAQLDAALAGRGGLVLLAGEAGIGKTTLAETLAAEAEAAGALVLRGGCFDLSTTPPYGPWLELLRAYQPNASLPQAPPSTLADPGTAPVSRDALFSDWSTFFTAITAVQPALVILEDLHWADIASLDLLRHLARRGASASSVPALLVVATYRDDELRRGQPLYQALPGLVRAAQPVRIDVRRLDTTGVRELLVTRYRLDDDDTTRLAVWLQARAEGNPFFTGELLLALEHEDRLHRSGDTWILEELGSTTVPPLVRQVIDQRLDQLDEPTQRLLEVAAVIGDEVQLDLWQAAGEVDDAGLAAALEQVAGAGLLFETADGERLRFSHALVRETLYTRQLVVRRRSLHRRVAELLADAPASLPHAVADHFAHAGDPRAIEWMVRAGERDLALHAPHDAIAQLSRARERATRHGSELPVAAWRALGQARETIGAFDLARADYEQGLTAARAHADRRSEWQLLVDLGALWSSRDYQRAGAYYQQALEVARSLDDAAIVADSLNFLGNWHTNTNMDQPGAALDHHHEALAIFERLGDRPGMARTFDLLGVSHLLAGNAFASAHAYDRAIDLFRELDDRRGLASSLATAALNGGSTLFDCEVIVSRDPAGWLRLAEEGLTHAREIGWRAGEAYALMNLASCLIPRGEFGRALRCGEQSLAIATGIEHRQWTTAARALLGSLASRMGAGENVREHFDAALANAQRSNSQFWIDVVTSGLARALIAAGELDAAERVMESLPATERADGTVGQRRRLYARAELALLRWEPAAALQIIEQLAAGRKADAAGAQPIPDLELLRGNALLALQQPVAAEAAYLAARASAERAGCRAYLWPAEAGLARACHALGRAADAAAAQSRAVSVIDELAASILDEVQRETFRQHALQQLPISVPVPRLTGAYGELTPREVEVLQLLTHGLTDAEIGERLGISFRTVGRHLHAIYGKLGVSSRTAAAVLAREHGVGR